MPPAMHAALRQSHYYAITLTLATQFCLVIITDRRPHSTIHRRTPSLSGCCCSNLEQSGSTPARYFCTFVACLPVTPQDSSIHHFLSQSLTINSARAVTLVISDTSIVHVIYLLTYYFVNFATFAVSMALNLAHRSFKVIHFGTNR